MTNLYDISSRSSRIALQEIKNGSRGVLKFHTVTKGVFPYEKRVSV